LQGRPEPPAPFLSRGELRRVEARIRIPADAEEVDRAEELVRRTVEQRPVRDELDRLADAALAGGVDERDHVVVQQRLTADEAEPAHVVDGGERVEVAAER